MIALVLREFHQFQAAGRQFLYLVPSAAVFELDAPARRCCSQLAGGQQTEDAVVDALSDRFPGAGRQSRDRRAPERPRDRLRASAGRRHAADASDDAVSADDDGAERDEPVQPGVHVLLRVRRGQDRRHGPRQAVEVHDRGDGAARASSSCSKESGRVAHMTFFGGETLLNFPVLKSTVAYARRRAAEDGKDDRLQPHDQRDAPPARDHRVSRRERDRRDRLDGRPAGAAEQVPRVSQRRRQLRRRRAEDQGAAAAAPEPADRRARDAHVRDDRRDADLPAPDRGVRVLGSRIRAGDDVARTSSTRSATRASIGCWDSSASWRSEFLEHVAVNRHHGFSNVKDTLEEIHKGVSKAYPCGAGLGLMGVSTDGDVAVCHRFAGSDDHKLGTVQRRHRPRGADGVPAAPSHRGQDRLPHVLGAAAVRGRLLPRSARALRDDPAAEPALLRMDSRMDRYLPAGVRRAGGAKSRLSRAIRSRRGESGGGAVTHLKAINRKAHRVVDYVERGEETRMSWRSSSRLRSRTSRSAARWRSRQAGRPIRPAARPGCASPSSATSSTATSGASGRPTCPIS